MQAIHNTFHLYFAAYDLDVSRSNTFFVFQVYLKPHFNYRPEMDNLIPCREAGLAFSKGDILHIVNKEDPNWWQVSST